MAKALTPHAAVSPLEGNYSSVACLDADNADGGTLTRRRREKNSSSKKMRQTKQEASAEDVTGTTVLVRWEDDSLVLEPTSKATIPPAIIHAIDSIRDAVQVSAALVDADGFTFKVTRPISRDVLDKLSYVLTWRSGTVVTAVAG